jgi:hypothetical protein
MEKSTWTPRVIFLWWEIVIQMAKGGKIVYLNDAGEEVSSSDPSAVKRFDTNKYVELPLGGRRKGRGKKTRRARKSRRVTRKRL